MSIQNPEQAFSDARHIRRADDPCSPCEGPRGAGLCAGAASRPALVEEAHPCVSSMPHSGRRLTLIDCLGPNFRSGMDREIAFGLSRPRKFIPSKYFYDAQGSILFDEICTLSEYYPTRTELEILETYAAAIMGFFDDGGGDLIEIGSGSDLKARRLLNALPRHGLEKIRYIPMDISRTGLVQSSLRILRDFEGLRVCGIIGDFTRHLSRLPTGRKLITFFGGTFGNFPDPQAIELLESLARTMGPEDRLLIGIDMLKDVGIMEAAYNDTRGVTARFNLNILRHVNQVMQSDFRQCDFEHLAFFNPEAERIEMHLKALRDVRTELRLIRMPVHVAQGETIHTEISRKFSREKAERLFHGAGLYPAEWYTDPKEWFSLVCLRRCEREGARAGFTSDTCRPR